MGYPCLSAMSLSSFVLPGFLCLCDFLLLALLGVSKKTLSKKVSKVLDSGEELVYDKSIKNDVRQIKYFLEGQEYV